MDVAVAVGHLEIASVLALQADLACLNLQGVRELLPALQMAAGRQLGACNRMHVHLHGSKLEVVAEHQLKHIKVAEHQHGAERMTEAELHMVVGTMVAERHMVDERNMVEVEEYVFL